MKKFLVLLAVSICSVAHAAYTAENKIIKVVIPNSSASGLATVFNYMEAYASKQNINMIPVFKPGAAGKIGISYASKAKPDGDTLLLATLSDYVESANSKEFDNVTPLTKTALTLVASKKSKIRNIDDIVKQEQETSGKLTWAHASSAQLHQIDNLVKASYLDVNKIYKVPFSISTGFHSSIINGDVDLGFILPRAAESLAAIGHLTIVDIDESTKQKMLTKANGTALFLPVHSPNESNIFWNKFVQGLMNDNDFKRLLNEISVERYTSTGPKSLDNVIMKYKQQ